jgi:hypothetical protein
VNRSLVGKGRGQALGNPSPSGESLFTRFGADQTPTKSASIIHISNEASTCRCSGHLIARSSALTSVRCFHNANPSAIQTNRMQPSAAVTKIQFHLQSTQAHYQEFLHHRRQSYRARRAQPLRDRQCCSAPWRRGPEWRRRRSESRSPRLASRG